MLRLCLLFAAIFLPSAGVWGSDHVIPDVSKIGERGLISSGLIYELEGRPTPQCHASTIAETKSGLVAAWFGGDRESHPNVGIWVSLHRQGHWTAPVEVVDGSEGREKELACWNPVLFQSSNGGLLLFYKVGLNPRLWWGEVVTSQDDGKTWSQPRKLGSSEKLFPANQNLLGPVKNKPLSLKNGRLLCPSSTENEGWKVHFEVSPDNGKTWQVIGPIDRKGKLNAIQPTLLNHGKGRFQILCRTRESVVAESWSSDWGKTWSNLSATSLPNPNSGIDGVTLIDGRHLLVYNHTTRSKSLNGREMLNVAISRDGKLWNVVHTLEREPARAEFSYPAVIQAGDGKVHITYTWMRQSVKHTVLDPEKF